MNRIEFVELMTELNNNISDDTDGYWLIEDSDYIYDNNIKVEEADNGINGESRWSINKYVVFKIDNQYYIKATWDSPATENQEGQYTNCYIEEVVPVEKIVTKYEVV